MTAPRKDETGKTYNRLTGISAVKQHEKSGRWIWLWQCSCGNTVEADATNVRNGSRQSCGCQKAEKINKILTGRNRKPEGESCKSFLRNSYRSNAKSRGYAFDLTDAEFGVLIATNCHYCGMPPSNTQTVLWNDDKLKYSGIDRMDNAKGYVTDNVVSCCAVCNRSKGVMSHDEFLEWVRRIYIHSIDKSFNRE